VFRAARTHVCVSWDLQPEGTHALTLQAITCSLCTCSYRARFIVGSAAELARKDGGGEAWLLGLRDKNYAEALEALTSLPGVVARRARC